MNFKRAELLPVDMPLCLLRRNMMCLSNNSVYYWGYTVISVQSWCCRSAHTLQLSWSNAASLWHETQHDPYVMIGPMLPVRLISLGINLRVWLILNV